MTDFAAAQERILARRAAREATLATQQQHVAAARSQRLLSLPPSLRTLLQHTLNAWDVVSGPTGTRPAFRVGQVDAELLDEELLSLLKKQAGEGLKLFGAHLKDEWGNEISTALRAVLWKLSIWDHGVSYGASLQGLKYVDARRERTGVDGTPRAEVTAWQKVAHGLLTVGGRYAWTRWEEHLSQLESGYDEPTPPMRRLSRLTTMLDTTHNVAAFMSFLVFLYDGRYRTLTDRLLRLRLVPSSNQTSREVSFEYLNRQLVWHAFTEFLLFLLPLVGIGRWKRWIARAWKKAKAFVMNIRRGRGEDGAEDEGHKGKAGELAFLPERTCAICYRAQSPTGGQSEQDILASAGTNAGVIGNASTDITNPYETVECGCIYCFVCLAQRIEAEEGEGWTCLRCRETVRECRPWGGDVEVAPDGRRERSGRKSIAWADELVEKDDDDDGQHHHSEERLAEVDPMPLDDEKLTE